MNRLFAVMLALLMNFGCTDSKIRHNELIEKIELARLAGDECLVALDERKVSLLYADMLLDISAENLREMRSAFYSRALDRWQKVLEDDGECYGAICREVKMVVRRFNLNQDSDDPITLPSPD
ncbi:hypothetical protein ACFQ14_01890 [Pseudahrensia aquimaris]|uniref:Lipoprotein n=1 Tax=Pseudahrensia aquimaris TaxID=744461 RepID=A0ABW3FEE1_9HYPH